MNEASQEKAYQIIVADSLKVDFLRMLEALIDGEHNYTVLSWEDYHPNNPNTPPWTPDLFLLDLDSHPQELKKDLEQLKKNPNTMNIPVLVATSLSGTASALLKIIEQGVIDFIRKPLHHTELCLRLHAALHLRHCQKDLIKRKDEMEQLTETLFLLNETIEEKNQELYQSVITDSLTKIYNRAFLLETLSKEFSRNRRHNLPLSCVMIDIDHFKSFNDLYGHKCGDFILIQVTAAILKIIRSEDFFGRLGGEEFLLILPGCTELDSQTVAEKVRLHIQNHPFLYEGILLHPRISLGVADNAIGRPLKSEDLIHHADLALYEAKRGGRNKSVLFSSIMHKHVN